MMQDRTSSEERLLKIIEGPLRPKDKRFGVPLQKVKGVALVKKWAKGLKSVSTGLDSSTAFRYISKVFLAACCLLTFFGLANFIIENRRSKVKIEAMRNNPRTFFRETNEQLPDFRLSDIPKESGRRNIFTFVPAKEESLGSLEVEQAMSTLKLVGIIWSENPQAMLEDTKEQKTYLLSTGEGIGQAKIKKILRDSVIIEKEDEEWVLR